MLQKSYDDFHKKRYLFLCLLFFFFFLTRSVSLLRLVALGFLIVIDYIKLNETQWVYITYTHKKSK